MMSAASQSLSSRDASRERANSATTWFLWAVGFGTCFLILATIGTILRKGLPAMTWEFLSQPPVEGMSAGGIWPMIRGSVLLMFGALLLVLPIGILSGICLAEYTSDTRLARFFRSCVVALAGTPSVIYGLFGLAMFVIVLKLKVSLLAGWLTIAMFALPTICLTTEQAIRAVPQTFIEAGLSLGLSKWQTIRRVALPAALPGIVTGVVLTTGRAAGEAPIVLLTAGIYYSTSKLTLGWHTLFQPVANLPYHLAEGYRQGGTIPEKTIWGTCLTLMLFVLLINLAAIVMRSRARKKQAW